MNILKSIENAYLTAEKRNWDKIYWAIDLHGTIVKPNYSSKDLKPEYYEYAKKTLQFLSKEKHIVLIFYTCSYPEQIKKIKKHLIEDKIKFDYIYKNPEAEDTAYGYYKEKPYFNVLLEDKGGFEPEKDWKEIYEYLLENIVDFKKKLKPIKKRFEFDIDLHSKCD